MNLHEGTPLQSNRAGRTIAIGDIHGCDDALATLIDAIGPTSADTVILLGDTIDRGPQSRQVLDRLIHLASQTKLIALLGNHEEALLQALREPQQLKKWLALGGLATLRSYGWAPGSPRRGLKDWFPQSHLAFIEQFRSFHETETHLFVHAGYVPDLEMAKQPPLALRWRVTDAGTAKPHQSGKIAVVGHTPQLSGEVLDLGFLLCIDTNCVRGGWLTALDVTRGKIWQADRSGRLR